MRGVFFWGGFFSPHQGSSGPDGVFDVRSSRWLKGEMDISPHLVCKTSPRRINRENWPRGAACRDITSLGLLLIFFFLQRTLREWKEEVLYLQTTQPSNHCWQRQLCYTWDILLAVRRVPSTAKPPKSEPLNTQCQAGGSSASAFFWGLTEKEKCFSRGSTKRPFPLRNGNIYI